MPEKTICIELFQPFAQYRNPFTFYYAQTFPLPPKSTIIGMLQNATNEWYNEKFWELNVSIHGGFESTFWNYQQLIKGEVELRQQNQELKLFNQNLPLYGQGLKSQRTPIYQQELFNGHLWIFIRGEDELITKIKNTLYNPNKILFLGRSEDIFFIRKIEELTILTSGKAKNSMWLFKPTFLRKDLLPIQNQKYPVYSIPTKILFQNNGTTIKSKSELTKTTERKPDFKTVVYTGNDYALRLSKETQFEDYKIGEEREEVFFRIPTEAGWL